MRPPSLLLRFGKGDASRRRRCIPRPWHAVVPRWPSVAGAVCPLPRMGKAPGRGQAAFFTFGCDSRNAFQAACTSFQPTTASGWASGEMNTRGPRKLM